MNQFKQFNITRDTNITALTIYSKLYSKYVVANLDPYFPSVYLLEDELVYVPQHLRAMYTRVYDIVFPPM